MGVMHFTSQKDESICDYVCTTLKLKKNRVIAPAFIK
jgi:hypothetical protein